jgi:hypothetical protein
MAEKPLQGFRVAILAADNFEEAELLQPRQALEDGALLPGGALNIQDDIRNAGGSGKTAKPSVTAIG